MLKNRLVELHDSYQFLDGRVEKILIQRQDQQSSAVNKQLLEFKASSIFPEVVKNNHQLQEIERGLYVNLMEQLTGFFKILKNEVDDLKRKIDIRKICLTSIMAQVDFFSEEHKIFRRSA